MSLRDARWFKTNCGRDVWLNAVHIRSFDHGFLEGRAELIREYVLKELPDAARELIRGTAAVYTETLETSEDDYPKLVYFCDLVCHQAIDPGADCSSLTGIWFGEDISISVPDFKNG